MDRRIYKIITILTIATFVVGVVLVLTPLENRTGSESASRFSSNQNDLIENRGSSISQAKSGEFIIEKGQSLGVVARLLAERDLIISRYLFVAYAILGGHERDFKAGRYKIVGPVSIAGLVKMFSRGLAEPEDIIVTVPEGLNVADADKILAEARLIKPGDFLNAALPLEGYLFPDTYRLRNCQPPITNCQQGSGEVQPLGVLEVEPLSQVQEIIKKMLGNFEAKIASVDNLSELNSDRLERAIIIASILEKEVRTEQDMRLVAGIIEKRLQLGMPLEIDATVAYSVCYPKFLAGEYCDVSLANIVDNMPVDSAYNTYKRKDLPAGPISNPGLMAIKAALNPQASDYLYYLSAKDGTTIFSKTAGEHIRARQKYLK